MRRFYRNACLCLHLALRAQRVCRTFDAAHRAPSVPARTSFARADAALRWRELGRAAGRDRLAVAAQSPFPPLDDRARRPERPARRRAATCRPSACSTPTASGIFPWYSDGPADPVVEPRSAHGAVRRRVPRVALAAQARAQPARSRSASTPRSATVIERCARARRARGRTAPGSRRRWSTRTASCTGAATRTRSRAGATARLVGGLYGVALGRVFFGESMFARETDASKVALVAPGRACCAPSACPLIDCQQETAHLASLRRAADPARASLRRISRELIHSADPPPAGARGAAGPRRVRTVPR